MKAARDYAKGPVPVDVCYKRTPTQSLVDALIARSVRTEMEGNVEERALKRDEERPLIHRPLATRYVGPHPEASADRLVVRFVVSSGEEARDDKELMIEGINFDGYDLNPVWLMAHDWEGLPIGRCLARRTYKRGNTYELHKDVEFTPEDVYPFGYQVGLMHARGFMRACSGGWMGTRIRIIRGADGKPERIIYLDSDWMETSSCAVGIDKYAVQEAVLRGVLKQDHLDNFARAARIAATGVAYEIKEANMSTALAERAPKPKRGEKRTLVDEHVMDNPIEEWPVGTATRAAGDVTDEGAVVEGDTPADEGAEGAPAGDAEPAAEGEGTGEGESPATVAEGAESGEAVGEGQQPDASAGDDATGQGSGEPETAAAPAADDVDPTVVRAAMRVLSNYVTRGGGDVVLRGSVSQALDASVDELYANVMCLAQCAEEMRYRASDVFYEGRASKAEVERAVRQRMADVTERVVRGITTSLPMQAITTDDMIGRCVSRAEAALARAGNSLSNVRDALTLFGDVEEEVAAVTRAGRKISRARRQEIATALQAARTAMERLQGVLDEEPDPNEEGEDTEDDPQDKAGAEVKDGEEADAAVGSSMRALVGRARGILAVRGVARGNSASSTPDVPAATDDAITDEGVDDVALDAAAERLLVERMAKLNSRLSGVVDRPPVAPAPKDEPAAESREAALARRASRLPGVRLPNHAR